MLFFPLFLIVLLSQAKASKKCFEDLSLKTTDLDLIHKIDEMTKNNYEFKAKYVIKKNIHDAFEKENKKKYISFKAIKELYNNKKKKKI